MVFFDLQKQKGQKSPTTVRDMSEWNLRKQGASSYISFCWNEKNIRLA